TSETDGLLSNDIRDLTVYEGVLFVATDRGVSRFANGVFTDTNDGLTDTDMRVFTTEGGDLYAGGADGVYSWDATGEAWVFMGGVGLPVKDMVFHGGEFYVLRSWAAGHFRLYRWDGAAFVEMERPADRVSALGAGDAFWLAGWKSVNGMVDNRTYPLFHARHEAGDAYTTWLSNEMPVMSPGGATFGGDGTIWVSDFLARSFANRGGDESWRGVYETAAASPDSSGLINYGGNMLFMATGSDGLLWTSQLGGGVLRHDPASWHTDPVVVENSGLASARVINGVVHPDGPVIFLSDKEEGNTVPVQVLVDTEHWRNPDNWATPSALDVGGTHVKDAVVTRRDIIWLAVQGAGLVRWDVNGPAAGPDDPLTWTDPTDDDWSVRVDDFPDTFLDPRVAAALSLDAAGTVWVGGNGLVGMDYDEATGSLRTNAAFSAKTLDEAGLISNSVIDVDVDRHGYVWVITAAGLNRVRPVAGGHEIDAWFDVVTYSGDSSLGILYSPSRITELPGVDYGFARLVADPAGDRILLSSSRGVTVIAVGDHAGGEAGDGGGLYLWPNPWHPDSDSRLAMGGIPAGTQEYLDVGIYNLDGQLVYHDDQVNLDQGFWSGSNRVGNPVATGMYIVRVQWRGNNIMRTLAVIR
ncbi:hypothetical protein DRQ50_14265, partial [bacterium]